MKRVIRRGVFETNSSSSHSLTLINKDKNKMFIKHNFELKNRDEKVAMLFGLIEHAEEVYRDYIDDLDMYDEYEDVKRAIIKIINDVDSSLLDKKNKIELNKLRIIVEENNIDVSSYFDVKDELFLFSNYFVIDMESRKNVLKFKEMVLETYCELEKMDREEAMKRLRYEANYPSPLKKILEDGVDIENNLKKYMNSNKYFKTNYEKSEDKDIVSFAKEYLLGHYNKDKCKDCGEFYCTRYFGEGSLNDCNCGMESYFEIEFNLGMALGKDFLNAKDSAILFLSDKCAFLGREY